MLLFQSILDNPGWWTLALTAVFLIGVTKSGFGSGVGLMIVPMMALAMAHIPGRGERAALGLLLPLLVLGDLIAVWQYRHLFSLRIVGRLLPATMLGVIVGGIILALIDQQKQEIANALIRIDIGIESVALVSLHWLRLWMTRGKLEAYAPKRWHDQLVGSACGVSSTLAHAAGPILTVYLLPQKLERQLYVGTCAIYFFILNSVKLPVYAYNGAFGNASPVFAAQVLPIVVVGALFGFWLNKRINDRYFSMIVYLITFGLGWYILAQGVELLWRHF